MLNGTYGDYLKSAHWAELRQAFVSSNFFNGKCTCCSEPLTTFELHHKTYKRLGRESLTDLCALCPTCHDGVHALINWRQRRREAHIGRPLSKIDKARLGINLWNAVRKLRKKFKRKGYFETMKQIQPRLVYERKARA